MRCARPRTRSTPPTTTAIARAAGRPGCGVRGTRWPGSAVDCASRQDTQADGGGAEVRPAGFAAPDPLPSSGGGPAGSPPAVAPTFATPPAPSVAPAASLAPPLPAAATLRWRRPLRRRCPARRSATSAACRPWGRGFGVGSGWLRSTAGRPHRRAHRLSRRCGAGTRPTRASPTTQPFDVAESDRTSPTTIGRPDRAATRGSTRHRAGADRRRPTPQPADPDCAGGSSRTPNPR